MGSTLVIVGITAFNKSYSNAVMTDFANRKGLLGVTGLITFVMGTVIVTLYNVWCVDWRVIFTLLGWLSAIGLDRAHRSLSIRQQCQLLGVARSGRVPDAGACA
jgi:hypothetical protein